MSRSIKRAAVVGLTLGATTVVGVSFAAWTANGSGNGQAKAIDKASVALSGTQMVGDIYPGASGDVVLTVTNPNPYPVELKSVTLDTVSQAVQTAWTTCGISASSLSRQLNSFVLAGKQGTTADSVTFVLDDGVSMSNSSDSACAAQAITVPLAVVADSAAGSAPTAGTADVIIPKP